MVGLKLALYEAMRTAGVGKAELARRLQVHLPQVDRLLDLEHASKLDAVVEALRVMGRDVEVTVRPSKIVIAKAGVPRARLVAIRRAARRPGGSKARIRISADFDAPLPDHILAAFDPKKR